MCMIIVRKEVLCKYDLSMIIVVIFKYDYS